MPLILSDEQAMLRDSARDFLAEQSPVSQLRVLRDTADADGFSRTLWRRFSEMGFTGLMVPEMHGGLGLACVEAGIVMDRIGHQLCASPFLASALVAVTALRQAGNPGQQQHWLPLLGSGTAIATLAVDEGSKHKPWRFQTRAIPRGDGWCLEGAKTLVLDGHVADLLIVAASLGGDPDHAGLFLVSPLAAGVTVERTVMVDAHNAARVSLQDVQLSADAMLGSPESGASALAAALDVGRAAVASELMGLADEVFDRTVQYLKDRRQFGKQIGEFQALQHRAAHLYTELQISHAAVLKANQLLDTDIAGAAAAVAVAKARAGRTATLAVQEAVQMHGGMGMTDAFELGFFMKRARVLEALWGDSNFHLDAMARRQAY